MAKTPQLDSFGWPCPPRFVVPVWLPSTPRSPESYCGSGSLLDDEPHHRAGGVLLPRTKAGVIEVKVCPFHTLQARVTISCVPAPSRSRENPLQSQFPPGDFGFRLGRRQQATLPQMIFTPVICRHGRLPHTRMPQVSCQSSLPASRVRSDLADQRRCRGRCALGWEATVEMLPIELLTRVAPRTWPALRRG